MPVLVRLDKKKVVSQSRPADLKFTSIRHCRFPVQRCKSSLTFVSVMQGLHWPSFLLAVTGLVSSDYTLLTGKHFIIGAQDTLIHLHVTRNASGHIYEVRGVGANTLAVLSQRFKFTYSFLQVNDTFLDKQNDTSPGLAYYMANRQSDVTVGTILMATNRLVLMDFAEGYTYATVVVVIPMPQPTANVAAIVEPFQTPVWIALFLFIPITVLAVYFSVKRRPYMTCLPEPDQQQNATTPAPLTVGQTIFMLVQILFSQGIAFTGTRRNAFYFVLGSWCLATFVLICAYNSVLISHILKSTTDRLVVSIKDLADKSNVPLAIDKGRGIDVVLSAATRGMFKQLGDRLQSNSKSRCTEKKDCINLVKYEHYAYLQSTFVALALIDEDFKATNKCQLAIATKSNPTESILAWAMPKKSPHTKLFTKGFMELHEAGLINFWIKKETEKSKNVNLCLKKADRNQGKKIIDNKTKITMKNFASAFYVLAFGCLLSFICFIVENVYAIVAKFRRTRLDVQVEERRRGYQRNPKRARTVQFVSPISVKYPQRRNIVTV